MKFVRKNMNIKTMKDDVFPIVEAAKNDSIAINATAGCLYGEDGKLFTFKTVFNSMNKINDIQKASYSSSPKGNKEYLNQISVFVLDDKVTNNHDILATPGGTGAVFTSLSLCLNENDTIMIPDIAWGNYVLMAQELNLNVITYDIYDLNDLFTKMTNIHSKFALVINSPCENPCGHAFSYAEWEQIISKLNSLNHEVVLINDIAYIEYAGDNKKDYFKLFNNINDNVLVLLASSCSKAFSFYGERLGALIAINNDCEFLDHFMNLATRLARTIWSNSNNSAMICIADVLKNHKEEYLKELNEVNLMLNKRTNLFIKLAKENNIDIYKYDSGFFVTLKIEDNNVKNKVYQKLLDKHLYIISVNKGIRVAVCSVKYDDIEIIIKTIKELL